MNRELVAHYDERIAAAKAWERHPLNTRALWLFRWYRFTVRWGAWIAVALGVAVGVTVGLVLTALIRLA